MRNITHFIAELLLIGLVSYLIAFTINAKAENDTNHSEVMGGLNSIHDKLGIK